MAKLRTTKAFFLAAVLLLNGCNSCTKAKVVAPPEDIVELKEAAAEFSLNAEKIFAHANQFTYRSDMMVTTKQGSVIDEDSELIEIVGRKPRLHLKKKTDSQHFIEIVAENDTYFVKSGGKDFRRGADSNPLYQNLINDGFNILSVLLRDFALKDRVAQKTSERKTYTISPGPISLDAPYIDALKKKTPSFNEIISGDVSGNFTLDEKTGLVSSGNLAVNLLGKDDSSIAVKASFHLDIRSKVDDIAMPKIRDDEPTNYPVDIGRKFNEMMGEKESK